MSNRVFSSSHIIEEISPLHSRYDPKITFRNIGNLFQRELIVGKKAFHINMSYQNCFDFIHKALLDGYRQFNSWDEKNEYCLKISKKGQIHISKHRLKTCVTSSLLDSQKARHEHDRPKKYPLADGNIIPFLVDIGIMTAEGRIVSSKQDKYRQINRFIEIVHDETKKLTNLPYNAGKSVSDVNINDKCRNISSPLHIVDIGCGKSYLTFALYYYLTDILKQQVKMTGIDANPELIEKCRQTANKYHFSDLHFICANIEQYKAHIPVDIVLSLHACDTATDYVLKFAVENDVKAVFAVPCCQHELNAQLNNTSYPILTRHGLLKERYAALLTDAIRANFMEYYGYKTQLIDFVDLDNTAKNIMLKAVKNNTTNKAKKRALSEIESLIKKFDIKPTIYDFLI